MLRAVSGSVAAVLMVAAVTGARQAPERPALRIVVIAGEDAVNVIQQRTAVAPIVEIRDRNNLPVPGAVVTFAVEGGTAASFGGSSALTVTANAAGQATVTGFTPASAGVMQIQVSAAFQGQTAVATITQTNVLTAAQAAVGAGAAAGASTATSAGTAPLFDSGCGVAPPARMMWLDYAGRMTTVTVQVIPNCAGGSGTTWD